MNKATLKPPISEAGSGRGNHMAGLGTTAQIGAVLNFGGRSLVFLRGSGFGEEGVGLRQSFQLNTGLTLSNYNSI